VSDGPVRRARTAARSRRPARRAVIAVTGAGAGVGAAVFGQLARSPRVAALIGVDTEVAAPAGLPGVPAAEIRWHQMSLVDPRLTTAFAGATAVAHLAVDLTPARDRAAQRLRNTRAAQTVLTAAFAAGVRTVVVVSSAMAYGARPDNPLPLPDDAPLRAQPEASVVGDLLEIERIVTTARRIHRGLSVTVLRPAIVLGAGDREPMASLLSAPRFLRIRGGDPHWQFCHVADLAAAVELAALGEAAVSAALNGAANVGCDGWLDHAELEHVSGRRSVELPERVAVGTAERLHRLGITPAPPSELTYLMHPWVVDTARLRAVGWRPAHTNADAVRAHLAAAERSRHTRVDAPRIDPRSATAAAGAAVALVGTAALVRRARRRRRDR
jgi:nucleoside-diphosphate-sugar epimerase